jgi:hypothetical protein
VKIRNRREVILGLAAVSASALAACQAAPTPAPAKVAPAAAGAGKLFLMVDLVQGSKNVPAEQKALRSCTLSSRFPRNSEMVWRMRVHDPVSGEPLGDKAVKSIQVQLANGKVLDGKFGPHPKDPPNEDFWTTSWVVPKDHATGTLKYAVEAVSLDGRSGKFEPFPTTVSYPAIIEEILPDAPAKA